MCSDARWRCEVWLNLFQKGLKGGSVKHFFKSRIFVAAILGIILVFSLVVWRVIEDYREVHAVRRITIKVNFDERVGVIKSLQGVNNGPLSNDGKFNFSSYYLELNVTYIRLHDAANVVDIHHVFPNFDVDPNIPESYDFLRTDEYLEAINAIGAQIIYRLGYSFEARPVHNSPPKDYKKWVSICVHIVKHYNDGWADGCHYNIQYWEIWNEPDITRFWNGTAEEYYRLYEETAKALKAYDPNLKVGGPALAGNLTFLEGFLEYCKEKNVPLDFVSWHIYSQNPYNIYLRSVKIRELLQTHGFPDAESLLTEWNLWPWGGLTVFGTVKAAAFDASTLIYLQDAPPDIANFYRGDAHVIGLFDTENGAPRKEYYAFKAFRMLLDTPIRVFCNGSNENGFAVIAGLSADNQSATILISNYNSEFNSYNITVLFPSWRGSKIRYEVYILDSDHDLELIKAADEKIDSSDLSIIQDVEIPSVCLIKLIKT